MKPSSRISGHTHMVCLLGSPVDHSMSPAIHTRSFELLGIDAVYLAFDVQPEDVGEAIAALRVMHGWDGANVTMPCKQAVIPFLDGLSPAAELMGAVNVLKKEADGRITGHNTDGAGFMRNLRKHGVRTEGTRMTLIGPGGAGSSILVQAALDGVARIDAFARTGGKSYAHAQKLIAQVSARTNCTLELHDLPDAAKLAEAAAKPHDFALAAELQTAISKPSETGNANLFDAEIAELHDAVFASDILVNASNVGMGEGCTDLPLPANLICPDLVVADAIYLPRETQLIREAAARGCRTVPGLGMLLEQAAESERIWYGADMPTDQIALELFG